ncbi:MAG: hypothetical protein PHV79_02785 [Clostridia bacterium]|nr:hypothetical protein [Clostridia bacterium]MDD3862756.1 hypothetical protein [Clostridia bacterium]
MKIQTNTDFIKNIIKVLFLFYLQTSFKNENFNLQHNLSIDKNDENNRFSQNYYFVKNSFFFYNSEKKYEKTFVDKIKKTVLYNKSEKSNILKNTVIKNLFKFLKFHFKEIDLPFGCLTFENPTQTARSLVEQGIDPLFIEENLISDFFVNENKAKMISKIYKNQNCIIRNDGLINLYINIPNFIQKQVVPQYINTLFKEIRAVRGIISNKPYVVKAIYISGDAAAVLNLNEFSTLFAETLYSFSEFTVECEDFKNLDKPKLQIMKNYGVTQVCLNAKSFSAKTLRALKKNSENVKIINFEIKDFLSIYQSSLELDFNIYVKLTAGLPQESLTTFKSNIKTAVEISPNFISVHSYSNQNNIETTGKMISFAYDNLLKEGYVPFYLYRKEINNLLKINEADINQTNNDINKFKKGDNIKEFEVDFEKTKNDFKERCLTNLENFGFCREGKPCIYDVDFMEQTGSIIGCGLGAVSTNINYVKRSFEKIENPTSYADYINEIENIISNKKNLFDN